MQRIATRCFFFRGGGGGGGGGVGCGGRLLSTFTWSRLRIHRRTVMNYLLSNNENVICFRFVFIHSFKISHNVDYILQYLNFSVTYKQLLSAFSAVNPVGRNVFTCVRTSVGSWIQADALQVIVAPLFMLFE